VTRPRLRDVVQGEVPLKSYARLHVTGGFSKELLEQILRGAFAQKYTEIVLDSAPGIRRVAVFSVQENGSADGPASEGVPRRSLVEFTRFALFLGIISGAARHFSSRWAWT